MLKNSALIVTDIQNDFCPGGALPVSEGDKIIPTVNRYIERFEKANSLVIASRDWHPKNHISFKSRGGIWPEHCVQNTKGAEFHPNLRLPKKVQVISKADNPDKEAYSVFQGTGLDALLRKNAIKELFVAGLTTDYCVKNTVIDGLAMGYKVYLLVDAIKGVEVNPGDSQRAIEEMISKGAIKIDELEQ
ncbi:MAG: bifunctional nicotinamidase/pyrazinamidase [Nitrososphaeria archaeon]